MFTFENLIMSKFQIEGMGQSYTMVVTVMYKICIYLHTFYTSLILFGSLKCLIYAFAFNT